LDIFLAAATLIVISTNGPVSSRDAAIIGADFAAATLAAWNVTGLAWAIVVILAASARPGYWVAGGCQRRIFTAPVGCRIAEVTLADARDTDIELPWSKLALKVTLAAFAHPASELANRRQRILRAASVTIGVTSLATASDTQGWSSTLSIITALAALIVLAADRSRAIGNTPDVCSNFAAAAASRVWVTVNRICNFYIGDAASALIIIQAADTFACRSANRLISVFFAAAVVCLGATKTKTGNTDVLISWPQTAFIIIVASTTNRSIRPADGQRGIFVTSLVISWVTEMAVALYTEFVGVAFTDGRILITSTALIIYAADRAIPLVIAAVV
jgi:hypothetical protein